MIDSRPKKKVGQWWVLGIFLVFAAASAAWVTAATFDSDIVPVSGSSIRLGINPGDISSINNTVFFSGSNVGIATSTPTQRLQIEGGGIRFTNPPVRPACDASTRGTIWVSQPGGATADTVTACLRSVGDVYAWALL